MRGLLSYEVEQALMQYIAMYRSTHTHDTKPVDIHKENPIPSVHRLKEDIKQFLVKTGRYEEVGVIQCVPEAFLLEGIHAVKGTDPRTMKKWLGLLKKYGCIKQLGVRQWEIV